MKQFLIQYRTHPDQAEHNERAVAAVFAELAASPIAGLAYQAMRLDDDTFVHIVTIPDGAPEDVISGLPTFQAFQQGLRERCVEPPKRRAMTVVGRHG
jgi:hypothetical protein